MIKTIIIDDEIASVKSFEIILTEVCENIEIIGKTCSPFEGIRLINKLKPDLVFLDINMPEINGFELLEAIKDRTFKVIFVTAYDEYAIKAFKANAQDYLLKPAYIPNVIEAVEKVKSLIELERKISVKNDNNINTVNKIAIPTNNSIEFYNPENIIRIEADGNYVTIHLDKGIKVCASKILKDIEELLPNNLFFRTHKSHIINLKKVKKLILTDGGSLELINGDSVPLVRRLKNEFLEKFGANNSNIN